MRRGLSEPADPLPISLVAHTVFCPRRAWLEAAGEVVASAAMEVGVADHARVDRREDERVAARRSVDVSSEALGVVGKCDVVQSDSDGALRIVEYKAAPVRRRPVVTDAQRVQLVLQGECLKEMGHRLTGYAVYFTNHRKMVDVDVGLTDIAVAVRAVAETREIVGREVAPAPLVDDPKCFRCSHAGVCLPDERQEMVVRRQIRVSDPAGETLYLSTPGSRASLKQGRVEVVRDEEALASLPIDRICAVVVQGNVDLSTGLIRELLWRSVPIVWASGRGRVVGVSRSTHAPNGQARLRQHVAAEEGDIELARELIASKISNQATQLRRSARDNVSVEVGTLRALAQQCSKASSIPEIFGIEGAAASTYFALFPRCLSAPVGDGFADRWPGRIGRSASDPVNVALNLVYGLLLADVVRSVHACGLDPHAGFVHSSKRNKPALALDLMEQFRPVVADSAVVGAINNGELKLGMFTDVLGGWRLRDGGRKALIAAYERRVMQEFRHPVFGYQVTWRRAMEVQARMVLGLLDGSQTRYRGIRTR